MHEGVLRDIAKEEAEKQQLFLQSASPSLTTGSSKATDALYSSLPSSSSSPFLSPSEHGTTVKNGTTNNNPSDNSTDCETGICDLSQRRIRPVGENDITPRNNTTTTTNNNKYSRRNNLQ